MRVKGHWQHVDEGQRQPKEAARSVYVTMWKRGSIKGLHVAPFLTVKSPLRGLKLQLLSINSLDLDKVVL